jgi:DNA-binding transcriptional ArsR family regulator
MPTQQEIATHLGMDQGAVSRHLSVLGIDWKASSMDEIRLAYVRHLRSVASGHMSSDGVDLTYERAMTERVDRELKLLTLAEKRKQVVNLEQLEPELSRMIGAFRTALLSRDDKLKAELDALYGISVDLAILNDHTRSALRQLARYDAEREGFAPSPGGAAGAAHPDGHHGVGPGTSQAERQGVSPSR